MKACIVLFALAAVAYADSDPLYGYGHGLILGSPCRNAWGVPVPCAGRKKREATAEAKPWLGVGYGGLIGHGYGIGLVSACHNAVGLPVPCAGRKKRSSEPLLKIVSMNATFIKKRFCTVYLIFHSTFIP